MNPTMRDNFRRMFKEKHNRDLLLSDTEIDEAITAVGTFGATPYETDKEILAVIESYELDNGTIGFPAKKYKNEEE